MRLLCIDSSGKTAGIAVCEEEKLLCESFLNAGFTHSQTLLPLLESTLATAALSLKEIDGIAVSIGPGSFTGLRIGVSMAKGIAQATGLPCIGVSTLTVLAESVRDFDGVLCPVMDARRGQVYNALFQGGASFCRLTPDRAFSVEALGNELQQKIYKKKLILVGDGAEMCYNDKKFYGQTVELSASAPPLAKPSASFANNRCVPQDCDNHPASATEQDGIPPSYAPSVETRNLFLTALPNRLQRASCVGFAAFQMLREGHPFVSAAELVPQYLRPSQAERQRLEKEKERQI